MTRDLRVALFVEGSEFRQGRLGSALEAIWADCLREALDLVAFAPIVPISKKHLVAMDTSQPVMSGAGEGLDSLIARTLKTRDFDAAVVAWDLVPAWNPEGAFCRLQETMDLYRFLAASTVLPVRWRDMAKARLKSLEVQKEPGGLKRPAKLEAGVVLTLCMEPMFEDLLVQDEAAARRALSLPERPKGWPAQGWGDSSQRNPDRRVLGPAIRSLFAVRPKPPSLRRLRGDLTTHKHEWAEFLLRRMLASKRDRALVLEHPIAKRLVEIASRRAR